MLTTVYFTSILLMAGLTGWLAFYAWHQPSVPGARAYSMLALGECLLALTEIFSMLSPGPAQALFWFNTHFIFNAVIPVLFLVFALEYNGHKSWLSRPLIATAFIIPVITQVILWSNALPGLWVKQEVSFHKSGSFWIVDTSTRIPGLWFVAHSFYSLTLLLAGIAVILITAWGKQRSFRSQGLLLSAGALVVLVTALIPIFGLVPPGGINPYLPGIGVSALLYALGIFRFQFLKRAPAIETAPPNTPLKVEENRSLAFFLLIFILLVTGIGAAGYLTYRNYAGEVRLQAESQLASIGALKEDGLQNWRSERLADAAIFYKNQTFSDLTQRFLADSADAGAQAELQSWLKGFKDNKEYDRVFLLDTSGDERISVPATPEPLAPHLVQQATAISSTDQVTFLDFHRDTSAGPIHLALLVPILANPDNHPLGLLVLRIDPNVYLFPYIQEWPIPSANAETLMVRRDGADVIYLNTLRFQADAALNLRLPLADKQVVAVKAVLGQTGIVEGVDYRGASVIADIRSVPGSPWFLVSRMDANEVYAPLRARLWQTLLFVGALTITGGAGLALLWRRQQVRAYQARYETAEALRESDEKFRKAFRIIPEAMVIARLADGRIVSVNQSFTNLQGYTDAEVIGKSSRELNIWANPQDREKIVAGLQAKGMIENYEAVFLTRTGERRNGLLSAAVIELHGEPHVIYSTRDITERKRFEEQLHHHNAYLNALQETTLELLAQLNPASLLENIVRRAGLLMDTASGFLDLVDPATGLLKPTFGMGALVESFQYTVQPGEGVAGTVWQTGQPLVVNDYDHWAGRIGSYTHGVLASIAGVPLLYGGKVLGVLGLGHGYDTQRTFEPGDIEILTQFGRLAALAIENAHLFAAAKQELAERKRAEEVLRLNEQAARRMTEHLRMVNQIGAKITAGLGFEQLMQTIYEQCQPIGDTDTFYIALYDDATGLLSFPIYFKDREHRSIPSRNIKESAGLTGYIIKKRQTIYLPEQANLPASPIREPGIPTQSFIGVPLILQERVIGVLSIQSHAANAYSPEQVQALELLATQVAIVIKNSQLYEQVQGERNLANALIDHLPGGFCLVNGKGQVVRWNQYVETFTGYTAEEIRNRDILSLFPVEEQARLNVLFSRVFAGEQVSTDTQLIAKQGVNLISIYATGTRVQIGDEAFLSLIGLDINERKQQEAQILATQAELQHLLTKGDQSRRALLNVIEDQKMAQEEILRLNSELERRVAERTAQLETSNQELEAFTYSVSHDLRAPLRGIDGWSQILLDENHAQLNEQGRESVSFIRSETKRMGLLIENLLQLSRISRAEMQRDRVDLTALAQSIMARLQRDQARPSVEVIIRPGLTANGDSALLEIVLTNLLGNAWKFTGTCPAARIEFGQTEQKGQPAFFVGDNGVGFDMAYAQKLFGVFQRLHRATEFPGTGIGLAIVQRIVHRHGGQVWADAQVNQGATFYFTLTEIE